MPSPSSKFQRVFKSLPNLGRRFQYRRYTIGNRSHTLWFSLFFVVARRSSWPDRASAYWLNHDAVGVAEVSSPLSHKSSRAKSRKRADLVFEGLRQNASRNLEKISP